MKLIDIIPTPKGVKTMNERKVFPATFVPCCYDLEPFFTFSEKKDVYFGFTEDGSIRIDKSSLLHDEEYRIDVNEHINITIGSVKALRYALASLYQMMTRCDEKILVPLCTVTDEPDHEWRGLMIDCARSFHTVEELFGYIDLCWLYKMNYLQLHLSDDEAFRLPMIKYPDLTSDVHYSNEDIAKLNAYAEKIGISLVPEVDTPGHSTVMQKAYPEIFGDKGILAFTEKSLKASSDIYSEVCDLFPNSDYIHIGGDEGRMGWWIDWPECNEYGDSVGYRRDDPVEGMTPNEFLMLRYLAGFIKSNAETVMSRGRKAVVWEGFHKITNDIIPKEVVVMSWDNSYQTAQSLCRAGFKIINCSWIPTYIVTPVWHYTKKQCFDWDTSSFGTINEGSAYYNGMFKAENCGNIIGGQLNSWGDTIEKSFDTPQDGHDDEFEKISERLPAIAENCWNREKRITFEDFNS